MYLIAIFLPFLMSISVLIFGKFIGNKGISIMVILGVLISLLISILIFNEIIINNSVTIINTYKWIDLGYFNIDISFYFDTITSIMLIIVCFISLLVHIYSTEYMSHDNNYHRFMSYLSLFTFFMLLLVTSDNYLLLFIGWEGVGLSSYLLINFWYLRILANKAAIKAMLINRIGDLGLLVGISIIFYNFFSLKYTIIFNLINYILNTKFIFFIYSINLNTIICLCLFIGAMGKSAQLGLHMWLPDAMEGPTPVSALIHAATMVTAGVFLVVRSSFIFEHSYNMLIFVSLIGGLTSLFSGLIGAFQFDIKKIVAYSTCSQLGYMFFSCGISNYNVSLFHLFNHAFFKALLFLSMGSIIHALCDEQDIRRMGGLIRYLPITYIMVFIGSLSLLAFPFLTGFYSKDFLLEFVYSMFTINSIFIYSIGVIAAFFTAFYSFRLIFWVFFSKANFFKLYTMSLNELNIYMLLPMLILSFFSIIIGYIFFDSFIGIGSIFWSNSVYITILNYTILDAEFSLFFIKFIPLIFSIIGILLFFILNKYFFIYVYINIFKNEFFKYIYYFFNKSLFFDNIINSYFIILILNFSYLSIYKYVEKGIFEKWGPILILKFFLNSYNLIKKFNDGLIYNYIFIILWFILFFILIFELGIWLNINYILFIFFLILSFVYFLKNEIIFFLQNFINNLNYFNEININKLYYTEKIKEKYINLKDKVYLWILFNNRLFTLLFKIFVYFIMFLIRLYINFQEGALDELILLSWILENDLNNNENIEVNSKTEEIINNNLKDDKKDYWKRMMKKWLPLILITIGGFFILLWFLIPSQNITVKRYNKEVPMDNESLARSALGDEYFEKGMAFFGKKTKKKIEEDLTEEKLKEIEDFIHNIFENQ